MYSKSALIPAAICLALLLICVFLKCKIVALELFGLFQLAFFSMSGVKFVPTVMLPFLALKPLVLGYNPNLAAQMDYPQQYLLNNSHIAYMVQAMGYTS